MKNKDYYDKLSGAIEFICGKPYWLVGNGSGVLSGDLAGNVSPKGYRMIGTSVRGSYGRFLAHRLNFYMVYGYLPKTIDHIDRDRDNNNISNLRECTASQNSMNRGKRSGCSSTFKGVCWSKIRRKWKTQININKTQRTLGYFSNEYDAALAYNKSAIVNHGEFAILNILENNELKRRSK